MGKITITINTGNAAFGDDNMDWEINRILSDLCENGIYNNKAIMDINGNKVGKISIEEDD